MPTEREWVRSIIPKLQEGLQDILPKKTVVCVADGSRLPYAYEVMKYQGNDPDISMLSRYETDIMISEILSEEEWIPA